jgi:hypothetical protein
MLGSGNRKLEGINILRKYDKPFAMMTLRQTLHGLLE